MTGYQPTGTWKLNFLEPNSGLKPLIVQYFSTIPEDSGLVNTGVRPVVAQFEHGEEYMLLGFDMIRSFVMSDLAPDEDFGPSRDFEKIGEDNGGFWYAREFMGLMGYDTFPSFQKAIGRAISVCSTLEFSISENFASVTRDVDGSRCDDYKLTRFACYLVAMNGDPNKPQVAEAQLHFATMAEAIRLLHANPDNVERVHIRDEVSQREKTLSGVAKSAGLMAERYGLFHNAGYMGMYNMSYSRLKAFKGVDDSRSLLDFMGKSELAANLFRITQTEEKIKNQNIRGQSRLEGAASHVGNEVRNAMIRASGIPPENLPIAEDIKKVRGKLKSASKELQKIDKPKKKGS